MKKLAYLMMASGLIFFGACEPNRDRATADENVLNERRDDTRGAPGDTLDQPQRQNPAVGEDLREGNVPDVNEGQRAEGHAMEGIPSNLRQKIDRDASENDRKILNSRPITHGGVKHYELTYLEKDGNQTKITYDEKGDEVDDNEE
ncbi:hypothetical protein [Pleomorphovibrio marinus]|uniref:hypothetical protein n=1 Tax=Pleomorphovibrio marinus TaxID=2164132 RepID=UPI000E0C1116|nr:hypothetical protein [Pleomorphovibrio marinus]